MISLRVVFATLLLLVALAPLRVGSAIQFDFSISASPNTVSLSELGQSVAVTIRVSLLSGTPQIVTLGYACSPLDCSLSNPQSGTPPFESVLLISTRPFSALPGSYQVIVQGSAGGNPPLYHNVVISVIVNQPTLTTTQTVSTRTSTGQTVTTTGQAQCTVIFHIDPALPAAYVLMEDSGNSTIGRFTDGQSTNLIVGTYRLFAPQVFAWFGNWSFIGGVHDITYEEHYVNNSYSEYIPAVRASLVGNAEIHLSYYPDHVDLGGGDEGNPGLINPNQQPPFVAAAIYADNVAPSYGDTVTFVGALVNVTGQPAIGWAVEFLQFQSVNSTGVSMWHLTGKTTTNTHGVFKLPVVWRPVNLSVFTNYFRIIAYPKDIGGHPLWEWGWYREIMKLDEYFKTDGVRRTGLWVTCQVYSSMIRGTVCSVDTNMTTSGDTAVLYLGGGSEVLSGGNGDRESVQFVANLGFKTVTMPAWQISNFVDDLSILSLGSLLKYGFAYRTIIMGFSAGGTAVAYTLVHNSQYFDAGIILNAEMIGPTGSPGGPTGDLSLFNTARFSGSIRIPHLLIWGRADVEATSPSSAIEWVKHAREGMVRLDTFDYAHGWQGTAAETQVEQDIASFLNSTQVGQITEINNIIILSNSHIGNSDYDLSGQILRFTVSGEGGSGSINLVIPESMLNGNPIVLLDGTEVQPLIASDVTNWYIFDTYSQSTHNITIAGQNTIPEFQIEFIPMIASVLFVALAIGVQKRRKRIL
jgi:hypothetical protein